MKIESVDHIAIQTNDFEIAFDFYSRTLGFEIVKAPFSFKDRTLCFLDAGSIKIELYSVKASQPPAEEYRSNRAGIVHVSFVVEEIHEALAELIEKGVKVIKEPFLPPSGDPLQPLIAFIEGPDRQEIEIRANKPTQ